MTLPITVVDAFADHPFAGNPAGSVVLDGPAPAAWMQQVAAEANVAATAFLTPRPDGSWEPPLGAGRSAWRCAASGCGSSVGPPRCGVASCWHCHPPTEPGRQARSGSTSMRRRPGGRSTDARASQSVR